MLQDIRKRLVLTAVRALLIFKSLATVEIDLCDHFGPDKVI